MLYWEIIGVLEILLGFHKALKQWPFNRYKKGIFRLMSNFLQWISKLFNTDIRCCSDKSRSVCGSISANLYLLHLSSEDMVLDYCGLVYDWTILFTTYSRDSVEIFLLLFWVWKEAILCKVSTICLCFSVVVFFVVFADRYTPQELKYFPLNTALYSPHKMLKSIFSDPNSNAVDDTEEDDDGPDEANDHISIQVCLL